MVCDVAGMFLGLRPSRNRLAGRWAAELGTRTKRGTCAVLRCGGSDNNKVQERELFNWLKSRGAEGVEGVYCLQQPFGERGLVANRSFKPKDTVFTVPLESVICDWPDGNGAFPQGDATPGSVRLAVKLMRVMQQQEEGEEQVDGERERGRRDHRAVRRQQPENLRHHRPQQPQPPQHQQRGRRHARVAVTSESFNNGSWGPYLRSLPPQPPAMLLAFTDPADLAWLEYPPLEHAVLSYRKLVARQYDMCGGMAGLGGATLEQFTWGLAIVGSRCLGAPMLLLALLAGGPGHDCDLEGHQDLIHGPDGGRPRAHCQDGDREVERRRARGAECRIGQQTPPTGLRSQNPEGVPLRGERGEEAPTPCVADLGLGLAPSGTTEPNPSYRDPSGALLMMTLMLRMAGPQPQPSPWARQGNAGSSSSSGSSGDGMDGQALGGSCNSSNSNSITTATTATGASQEAIVTCGKPILGCEVDHAGGQAAGVAASRTRARDGVATASALAPASSAVSIAAEASMVPRSTSALGGQLRMLAPLLDLMNHRGPSTIGRWRSGAARNHSRSGGACDTCEDCGGPIAGSGHDAAERAWAVFGANVRWELRPPQCNGPDRTRASEGVSDNPCVGADGVASGQLLPSVAQGALHAPSVLAPRPTESALSGWHVAVVATCDVAAGQELLLCYDPEGSNDTFALHYGFVPPFNPYDDVQLYGNLVEALTWHRTEVAAGARAEMEMDAGGAPVSEAAGRLSRGPLAPHLQRLTAAELDRWYRGAEAAAAAALGADFDPHVPMKLYPGARLSPTLTTALYHLAPDLASARQTAGEAVFRRCAQLLHERSPMLADLALLIRQLEATAVAPARTRAGNGSPAEPAIQPGHPGGLPGSRSTHSTHSAGAAATGGGGGGGGDNAGPLSFHRGSGRWEEGPSASGGGGGGSNGERECGGWEDAAFNDAATWQAVARHYEAALSAQPPCLQELAGLAPRAGPLDSNQVVVNVPLAPAGEEAALESLPEPAQGPRGGGVSVGGGNDWGTGVGGAGGASAGSLSTLHPGVGPGPLTVGRAPGSGGVLTPQQQLALTYRLYKKMLLWDYILAHVAE